MDTANVNDPIGSHSGMQIDRGEEYRNDQVISAIEFVNSACQKEVSAALHESWKAGDSWNAVSEMIARIKASHGYR